MRIFLIVTLIALCAGCNRQETPAGETGTGAADAITTSANQETTDEALNQAASEMSVKLWQMAADNWQASLQYCQTQQQLIEHFITSPDDKTLDAAQQAWLTLHTSTQHNSSALAFAQISPDLFAPLVDQLRLITSEPIAPGFIDAVDGYPYSGLVHDFSTPINRTTLTDQHQLTDDSEALLGLYVIEFLLFGEKGERDANDFIAEQQGTDSLNTQQRPHNRRRDLLKLTSKLLCDDIKSLKDNWANTHSSLSAVYFSLPPLGRLMLWREAVVATLHENEQKACAFAANKCTNIIDILSGVKSLIEKPQKTGVESNAGVQLSANDAALFTALEQQLATLNDGAPLDTESLLAFFTQTPGQIPLLDNTSRQ